MDYCNRPNMRWQSHEQLWEETAHPGKVRINASDESWWRLPSQKCHLFFNRNLESRRTSKLESVPYRIMQTYANLNMIHYGSLKKHICFCLLDVKCKHVLSSPNLHSLHLWNMTLIRLFVWSSKGDENLLPPVNWWYWTLCQWMISLSGFTHVK